MRQYSLITAVDLVNAVDLVDDAHLFQSCDTGSIVLSL